MVDPDTAALAERLRQFIADGSFHHNDRLPPERDLAAQFGVTRSDLRKALAVLEADGLIWRHVGRGTFIGSRPVLNLADVAYLGELASPSQVLTARIAVEPELARLAALFGARADFEAIRHWAQRCRTAPDWRSYEASDNNLHHAIAKATHNKLLLYLFDTLNTVRRSTVWGQRRTTTRPPPDHFSFDQHDAILAAIVARDGAQAAQLMRDHLQAVRDRVLPTLGG
ncbi:MAG TPA: FadR/GntR family transcriptional regulator [Paracoccaceae bacterium]|nr:FadR/GntR family transcriptional regulator [Paracoccaceae bacterium]